MVPGVYFKDNCFTFIPVVVFDITLNFIKVVRNKRLNGTSVTAIWVMIHPFVSKKVECRNDSFSTRHFARLCGNPGLQAKVTTQFTRITRKYKYTTGYAGE